MGIIYFVVLIGVIITVHEFGHFIAAKRFNIYVPEFAIGMGPVVFQKQKGETKYSLRAFPIGGFVSMAGETGVEGFEDVPVNRTIKGIAGWKQLIVMLAGVFNNMVLALILFFVVYANLGARVVDEPILESIMPGSVAETAGLQAGDRLVSATFVDGTTLKINSYTDYMAAATFYEADEPVTFIVSRNNVEYEITLTKSYLEGYEEPMFGFSFASTVKKLSILESIPYAFVVLKENISLIFMSISKLIRGRGLNNLSGPVGIYETASEQASYGILNYLYLIGVLSVNVGVMNLLPLPMLDGGQAIIVIGEMIAKKKLNNKIRTGLMVASMALLLALMLFVTYQDVLRILFK